MRTILTAQPNFRLMPVNRVVSDDEYNSIVRDLTEKGYKQLIRTKSGGVSRTNLFRGRSFDSKLHGSCFEITMFDENGWCRIQKRREGSEEVKDNGLSGTQAFNKLTRGLTIVDIDEVLPDKYKWYKIETIIPCEDEKGTRQGYTGASHIDLNSCFAYYMAEVLPVLKERIYKWFPKRKQDPTIKAVFNYAIGCFRYKYPNAWKKCMYLVHNRLEEERKLIDGTALAYNTDGIWFTGTYRGQQSTELGGVKIDHENCTIRFKSAGCYEFIENGKYYSAARGIRKERLTKWGDIYYHKPVGKLLNKDGLIIEVEREDIL